MLAPPLGPLRCMCHHKAGLLFSPNCPWPAPRSQQVRQHEGQLQTRWGSGKSPWSDIGAGSEAQEGRGVSKEAEEKAFQMEGPTCGRGKVC